ncbi:alpha/beta fold hydrolase [Olsenella sp. Marseille-P4559]|uniref:alpha/beta fold hydrolase n=1 Tax=Olsenella sp. Marseille-P4559 TaxID=2364795 RepID=UPI00102F8EC2|nr:alpha/beta fold hydrolase [Olsenella sp. Marseille-P4559]
MALLSSYYLPGIYAEDHSVEVPLDWRGTSPAALAGDAHDEPSALALEGSAEKPDPAFVGKSIKLFYRVLCSPENVGRDLPLIVFLQGGPGGACPRPLSPQSDGWVEEALRHFRVVLPDQRGCGRSTRMDGARIASVGAEAAAQGADPARRQADYLKRFLADSIIRDFEYLRLAEFEGQRWVTLGQSYGGFLTLANLSAFPAGVAASFTCGGIPHVPASASEVYAHTFPRMAAKTRSYYERYPEDERRVALVADRLAAGDVTLPDGSPLSVRRLQLVGGGLGMKSAPERLHALFDLAFADGDGSCDDALAAAGGDASRVRLFGGFVDQVQSMTSSYMTPLYWTLQELIYADATLDAPIMWAAAREASGRPEFSEDARPLMLFAEAVFPWMFEEDPSLKPFAAAMDVLMADTAFGRLYDQEQLARNEVPLYAAVYFDDAYVDSELQLDTLSRVGASHAWVTNEFEHDGLHGSVVFKRLYDEAYNRGDLKDVR